MTVVWGRVPPAARDALAGVALCLVWFAVYRYWRLNDWYPRHPDTYVLAGSWSGAAVALKRVAPLPLLAVTAVAYPLLYDPALQTEFHLLPVLIAGYGATSGSRLQAAGAALLAGAAVLWLTTTGAPVIQPDLLARILFDELVVIGVVLLGVLVHEQRRTAATLAARNAELERLQGVEAARVVAEERTRIARELHDVIAHHLTALIIRAQAADRVATTQPEVATASMGWIATTAKEALTAMRQTVRVLRSDATLTPGPTLADLPDIAARVRDAGLAVDLRLPPSLPPLDPQAELAVVRIVQEALTNTLRHAHAHRAVVSVRSGDGGLVLDVDDDGRTDPAATGATGGHGLLGMRERAASCGGSLDIGPSALGGWRVRVWLPA